MKRTNIYLEDAQLVMLDELSRARGVSRAELIRQLLNGAVNGSAREDLAADLAAIHDSFGALRGDDDFLVRGPDERSHHLERIARR